LTIAQENILYKENKNFWNCLDKSEEGELMKEQERISEIYKSSNKKASSSY
jgi:hypothetical protein